MTDALTVVSVDQSRTNAALLGDTHSDIKAGARRQKALTSPLSRLHGSAQFPGWARDAATDTDPIELAVRQGIRAGYGRSLPQPDTLSRAASLIAINDVERNNENGFEELLVLVQNYPTCERIQILAARALDLRGSAGLSCRAWRGIHDRFPQSIEPFRMALRWLSREIGFNAARDWLEIRFPSMPESTEDLLVYAWGHHDLRSFECADEAFSRGLMAPGENAYLQFSKSLVARGEIWRAHAIIVKGIGKRNPHRRLSALLAEVEKAIKTLDSLVPNWCGSRVSEVVLAELFRRTPTQRQRRRIMNRCVGRVAMITGSLGAGGAERQFAVTAKSFRTAIEEDVEIAGHRVRGPVEVYCRSLSAKPGTDFFLPMLRDADIRVSEYPNHETQVVDRKSILASHEELLRFLPPTIAEGTRKLTDHFRRKRPDVVQIWQDGSIYATGLAALMAGVPRIVLNVRTLPPVDRPDRFRPEYELIFKSLLSRPNVVLTANSKIAARRYAEWLSVSPDRVQVIYNGVELSDSKPTSSERDTAARFDAATDKASFTVGSVMRFDENKRPFLWLESAGSLLRSVPNARFILVGDGPLWGAAVSRAHELGVAGKVFFVGRSHAIKFWLSRMNAFLLLSRFEGLPNVLIEAQLAGVPVCTTAAGGCAETIRQNSTGFLLPGAEKIDGRTVADQLMVLQRNREMQKEMGHQARIWAQNTFSIASMMERTVAAFTGDAC